MALFWDDSAEPERSGNIPGHPGGLRSVPRPPPDVDRVLGLGPDRRDGNESPMSSATNEDAETLNDRWRKGIPAQRLMGGTRGAFEISYTWLVRLSRYSSWVHGDYFRAELEQKGLVQVFEYHNHGGVLKKKIQSIWEKDMCAESSGIYAHVVGVLSAHKVTPNDLTLSRVIGTLMAKKYLTVTKDSTLYDDIIAKPFNRDSHLTLMAAILKWSCDWMLEKWDVVNYLKVLPGAQYSASRDAPNSLDQALCLWIYKVFTLVKDRVSKPTDHVEQPMELADLLSESRFMMAIAELYFPEKKAAILKTFDTKPSKWQWTAPQNDQEHIWQALHALIAISTPGEMEHLLPPVEVKRFPFYWCYTFNNLANLRVLLVILFCHVAKLDPWRKLVPALRGAPGTANMYEGVPKHLQHTVDSYTNSVQAWYEERKETQERAAKEALDSRDGTSTRPPRGLRSVNGYTVTIAPEIVQNGDKAEGNVRCTVAAPDGGRLPTQISNLMQKEVCMEIANCQRELAALPRTPAMQTASQDVSSKTSAATRNHQAKSGDHRSRFLGFTQPNSHAVNKRPQTITTDEQLRKARGVLSTRTKEIRSGPVSDRTAKGLPSRGQAAATMDSQNRLRHSNRGTNYSEGSAARHHAQNGVDRLVLSSHPEPVLPPIGTHSSMTVHSNEALVVNPESVTPDAMTQWQATTDTDPALQGSTRPHNAHGKRDSFPQPLAHAANTVHERKGHGRLDQQQWLEDMQRPGAAKRVKARDIQAGLTAEMDILGTGSNDNYDADEPVNLWRQHANGGNSTNGILPDVRESVEAADYRLKEQDGAPSVTPITQQGGHSEDHHTMTTNGIPAAQQQQQQPVDSDSPATEHQEYRHRRGSGRGPVSESYDIMFPSGTHRQVAPPMGVVPLWRAERGTREQIAAERTSTYMEMLKVREQLEERDRRAHRHVVSTMTKARQQARAEVGFTTGATSHSPPAVPLLPLTSQSNDVITNSNSAQTYRVDQHMARSLSLGDVDARHDSQSTHAGTVIEPTAHKSGSWRPDDAMPSSTPVVAATPAYHATDGRSVGEKARRQSPPPRRLPKAKNTSESNSHNSSSSSLKSNSAIATHSNGTIVAQSVHLHTTLPAVPSQLSAVQNGPDATTSTADQFRTKLDPNNPPLMWLPNRGPPKAHTMGGQRLNDGIEQMERVSQYWEKEKQRREEEKRLQEAEVNMEVTKEGPLQQALRKTLEGVNMPALIAEDSKRQEHRRRLANFKRGPASIEQHKQRMQAAQDTSCPPPQQPPTLRAKPRRAVPTTTATIKALTSGSGEFAAPAMRTAGGSNVPLFSGVSSYITPVAKSNRLLVENALRYVLLAGMPNRGRLQEVLQQISYKKAQQFILLVREIPGCQFRALYEVVDDQQWKLLKICGRGPTLLQPHMMDKLYKYSSGGKRFDAIAGRTMSANVDAVSIGAGLWQKRPV